MNAKWKVARLGEEKTLQNLSYAVQEFGRECEIIPFGKYYETLKTPSEEEDCVVVIGSIRISLNAHFNRPNWYPKWHVSELFNCQSYYAYWGKNIVQKHYAFLPFSEMVRRKEWVYNNFGIDGQIFIRPDDGDKSFNAEVVATEHFEKWRDITVGMWSTKPELLCVVSSPVNIAKELRLVMYDNKVWTGSLYRVGKSCIYENIDESKDKNTIIEFAESVVKEAPPLPSCYVLDVALTDDGYKIMEVGCVCCAGYYDMDLHKLAESVTLAAEADWAKVH